MWKICAALLFAAAFVRAEDAPPMASAEEWAPLRKTGLFEAKSPLWIAPDMQGESVGAFSSRLLEGARQGEAKAMATLGRFFYARGDAVRAGEWCARAADAGHGGAQLDLGALAAQGFGRKQDLVEAYQWIWLATWGEVPGAEAALREISQKLDMAQVLAGVQRAAEFLRAHENRGAEKTPAAAQR